MKKIVAGLAALAMAASVFAVDVTAQLKMESDIFDSTSKSVLTTPVSTGWDGNNTYLKFSASGDKSGAQFSLNGADGEDIDFLNYSLWFKPVDALKITIGNAPVGASIAQGTFAWWAVSARLNNDEDAYGVRFDLTFDALSFAFYSAKSALLNFSNSGYAVLGDFWFEGKYNLGDAGTIQGFVTKGANINAYGVGGWETTGLAFGVAYNNMPWQQTGYYADVVANLDSNFKFEGVASQIGGQYCTNGLALRLTNMIAYGSHYGSADKYFDYGFAFKASYAIDAWTPWIQLVGNEILDKKLGLSAGVDTKVGSVDISIAFESALDFNSGSTFSFKLPVYFTVAL